MSLRHLPNDRVTSSGHWGGATVGQQASPSMIYGRSASPTVPDRTYGSMPEVPPSNVFVRGTRSAEAQYGKGSLLVTKSGLLTFGTLILALLCFMPVWDATQMLRNRNFVEWIGIALPVCIFVLCAVLIIFFVFMAEGIFKQRYPVTMQSVALVCSLFVTIAGLFLIVASLPLSHKTVQVANELAYDCAGYRARSIAIANQNLAVLRARPECLAMHSIEECEGYVESPESLYLKYMEQNFRCSGFCVRPGAVPALPAAEQAAITEAAAGTEAAPAEEAEEAAEEAEEAAEAPPAEEAGAASEDAAGLIAINAKLLRTIADRKEADARSMAHLWQPVAAPPTLFTAANFQATCDGAASRDLLNFGREVGWQFWYTGIILVTISILMGIFEWSTMVLA